MLKNLFKGKESKSLDTITSSSVVVNAKTEDDFKFDLGDILRDTLTGFEGLVEYRMQWLTNCNTYGLLPVTMKNGKPQERVSFDETRLQLVQAKKVKAKRHTGGFTDSPSEPNKL